MRGLARVAQALLIVSASALCGCALLPQAVGSAKLRVQGDKLVYTGRIDDALLQQFLAVLRPPPALPAKDAMDPKALKDPKELKELHLASSGGDMAATYRIAALIREHRLNVVATGPCISACSILFSAGQRKTVLPGAYLAYHWNGQSNPEHWDARLRQGLTNSFHIRLSREVEDRFNAEVGVSQALYDDAWLMYRAQFGNHRWPLLEWFSKTTTAWLPTPQELACYGLKVDQFWYPEGGDLSKIPPNYQLGGDLFTTQSLIKARGQLPAGLSNCVGKGLL